MRPDARRLSTTGPYRRPERRPYTAVRPNASTTAPARADDRGMTPAPASPAHPDDPGRDPAPPAPSVADPQNIFNIWRQMSVVAVLGIGMTLVILIGGIDLSRRIGAVPERRSVRV